MDTPKLTKNEELNLKGVAAELHATILRRHLGNVKGQAKWKNEVLFDWSSTPSV